MGRHGYPTEFRRRALDLIASGRKVCDVARDLGISDQTVYAWRRQECIDQGLETGVTTDEGTKLKAAKKKIAALESELAIHRRASELLKECHDPKVGSRPSR
jgi:transposase